MGALKDFEQSEIKRVLDACTACGKCYEACPMTVYSPLLKGDGAAAPESGRVVAGVLDVLRASAGSPEALAWVGVCTGSGECVPACPEAVNPKMMMRLARITALGGLGAAPQITIRADPNYFSRIRAFAEMQLTGDEKKEWM